MCQLLNELVDLTSNYLSCDVVYKYLMLEVIYFCVLMMNITFFLLNITKTWRIHAPKKSCDSLKSHISIITLKQEKATFGMYKLNKLTRKLHQ